MITFQRNTNPGKGSYEHVLVLSSNSHLMISEQINQLATIATIHMGELQTAMIKAGTVTFPVHSKLFSIIVLVRPYSGRESSLLETVKGWHEKDKRNSIWQDVLDQLNI